MRGRDFPAIPAELLVRSLACAAMFLAARTARADWPTYQGGVAHTGYVPGSYNFTNVATQWQTTVLAGAAMNGLAVGGGTVIVTDLGNMRALDQASGTILWSKSYVPTFFSTSPPAYATGVAYLQTDGHDSSAGNYLRAYNARTGAAVFTAPYSAQFQTYLNPTPYGGNVYVGGGYYGGMYSFNATSGAQGWFNSVPYNDYWTPAVDGRYAYAYTKSSGGTTDQGFFTVIDMATGATAAHVIDPNFDQLTGLDLHSAVTLGQHHNAFTINGNRLLSWDTTLDATHTPHIGWSLSDGYTGQPTLANGRLYTIDHGGLSVLDELTGSFLWSWQPPFGPLTGPMIALDNLLIAQSPYQTYAIDLASHSQVWSYLVSGPMAFSDGTLYIGDENGSGVVYAFSTVPEPGTLALLSAAAAGGWLVRRRRRSKITRSS
jgi:outer membrane protein assembly factor BamB